MTKNNFVLIFFFLITAYGTAISQTQKKTEHENKSQTSIAKSVLTPEELFAKVSPSVVKIVVKDDNKHQILTGSGFFVALDEKIKGRVFLRSVVITNYHVIRPAVNADIIMADGTRLLVDDLISSDESQDLAVIDVLSPEISSILNKETIKSKSSSIYPPKVLTVNTNYMLPIGTKIYTVGSPEGLTNSLSEGLVSGRRDENGKRRWLQFTAPISHGSSGGPLLTADGAVVGVITSYLADGQNLNFAIPSCEIKRLLENPRNPKPLWKGSSIEEEDSDAESQAITKYWINHKRGPKDDEQLGLYFKGKKAYESVKLDANTTINDYDSAIRLMNAALKADSTDFEYGVHFLLGKIHCMCFELYHDKSNLEEAIDAFKKSSELKPDFSPALYQLSKCYMDYEQYPEALVSAELLARLVPRCSQAYMVRGEAYGYLGRRKAAIKDFQTALDLQPRNPDIYKQFGYTYIQLKDIENAIGAFQAAIKLAPKSFIYHWGLADAYKKGGMYAKAISEYEEVIKVGGPKEWARESIEQCRIFLRQSTAP